MSAALGDGSLSSSRRSACWLRLLFRCRLIRRCRARPTGAPHRAPRRRRCFTPARRLLRLRLSIVLTFAGVVLGCATTLALLRDPTISRPSRFGLLVRGSRELDRGMARRRAARRHRTAHQHGCPRHRSRHSAACSAPLCSTCGKPRCAASACLRAAPGAEPDRRPLLRLACGRCGRISSRPSFSACSSGYVIGCSAGFLVAILAHRYSFLGRGLLPIGNFVSALPIVGIAPIMVMWFGFDWPSKAAVVVVITFFPMLVNTLAGLERGGTHRARPDALLRRRPRDKRCRSFICRRRCLSSSMR